MNTYTPSTEHVIACNINNTMIGDHNKFLFCHNFLTVYKTIGTSVFALFNFPRKRKKKQKQNMRII